MVLRMHPTGHAFAPQADQNHNTGVGLSDHPPSFPRLLVDLVFSNVCFACRLGFDAFEAYEHIKKHK